MRQNSRLNDELRETRVELNVAKHFPKSSFVSLGQTKVQINFIPNYDLKFQISGDLTLFEQLVVKSLEYYLANHLQVTGIIEIFILSNDGSLGVAILQALKEILENERLKNSYALTIGILNDELLLDLDLSEERQAKAKLFLIQTNNGQIDCLLTDGEYKTKDLCDSLVIAEGIIDKLQDLNEIKERKTMQKEIVIATNNQGKAKEFAMMFGKFGYEVKTLQDFKDIPEIIEDGKTFTENAAIKAQTLSRKLNLPVLGDDSGLCVDALKGLPGIYSARFAKDHDDAANNAKLLSELAGVPPIERTAHFHTSLVMSAPGKENLVVEGEVEGLIATIPAGDNGFGYDPLFYLPELDCTMAQLTPEQKNQISHRAVAMSKLARVWQEWLEG